MPITCKCPSCSASYTVPEAWIGKKGKCKKCGNTMVIQAPTAPQVASSGNGDEFDAMRTMPASRSTISAALQADEFDAGATVRPQHRPRILDDGFDRGPTLRAPSRTSPATDEFDHGQTIRASSVPIDNQPRTGTGSKGTTNGGQPIAAWELKAGGLVDGRYLIIKRLGKGGMGAVYKAVDQETEAELAVKVLLPELAALPDAMRDLKKEVAIAQQLTHQNLLRVNYLGTSGERAFLVMEYIDGEDLEAYRLRKGGKLPEDELLRITTQLLSGLDYLHERGMVHLDIKPQNIMVSKTGEVKLTDFGISRTIKEQLASRDQAQWPVGTLCYMAPEQLRGEVCDRRTDIYATGVMLYQLLVGQLPFSTQTREEIVAWHLGPGFDLKDTPASWRDLLKYCVARKPADRFTACSEILTALRCLESGEQTATLPPQTSEAGTRREQQRLSNFIRLADAELEAGNLQGAEAYFKKVLEEEPENPVAWLGRAKTYAAGCNSFDRDKGMRATTLLSLLRKSITARGETGKKVKLATANFLNEFALDYWERLVTRPARDIDAAFLVLSQRLETMTLVDESLKLMPLKSLAALGTKMARECVEGVRLSDGSQLGLEEMLNGATYETMEALRERLIERGRRYEISFSAMPSLPRPSGGPSSTVTGLGKIVITRSSAMTGGMYGVQVVVDGQLMAHINNGGTITLELPAGDHLVEVSGGGLSNSAIVRIAAGQTTHYQMYFSTWGILGGGLNFKPA